ncbi:hypothetical protein SAMN05216464_11291 [Mucilaginibacter pineti]|uniref:Uncharacterized protein n=1 Tax=Mucilaginibacter pineti TaxID=1391627 RepID=A0A1G7HZN5_9SPHI|nr:hypothetical protein [Mucilaginibacter pineti]SDF05858.1 hypothetical protein SAMN05216464_11291 [Mucilaginibacter pineti]
MISFFRKKNINQDFIKRISVYISETEEQIIIAPFHRNNSGLFYEQDICSILNYPVDDTALGEQVIRNLDLCEVKDKNLKGLHKKEWPAYKYSKLKTLKAFEMAYKRISIRGANTSNIILVIECDLSSDKELSITSGISANANKKDIGKRIMKVFLNSL